MIRINSTPARPPTPSRHDIQHIAEALSEAAGYFYAQDLRMKPETLVMGGDGRFTVTATAVHIGFTRDLRFSGSIDADGQAEIDQLV